MFFPFDFSKAFNIVSHSILVATLERDDEMSELQSRACGKLVVWKGWKNSVLQCKDQLLANINGIPQGLILGLMLFYACRTFNILRMNRMECALSKPVDDIKLERAINTLQGRTAFQRDHNRLQELAQNSHMNSRVRISSSILLAGNPLESSFVIKDQGSHCGHV